MKKKKLLSTVFFVFLLSSCDFLSLSSGSYTSSTTSNEITSTSTITSSEEESSSTSETSSVESRPTTGTEILDFYAINDLHGAINENPLENEPGLAKISTYLKAKQNENPGNTITLSTGDMFQGTFEVYHNKGEVVTEAMNEIGFDLMAIGNHEFDWGPEYIRANTLIADFPYLGANIMNYPEVTEKSDIGEEYVILERGHLKIGVIGAIGQNQMTSICSRLINDVYFESIGPVVTRLSTKLREEENVDLVVLAVHAGQDDVPHFLAEERYVDLVFNAHTHRYETKVVAGVPYIQGGAKGRFVSHIQIEYDYSNNDFTVNKHENVALSDLTLVTDLAVQDIIDTHSIASDAASNEPVGELLADMDRYYPLPNILNYATARLAALQGYDQLDYVFSGGSREPMSSGHVTYGDLFHALPFDNETYIVKVKGSELLAQKEYNQFYRVSDYPTIEFDNMYYLAIQDFSLLHQDINKAFNFFPSLNPATDIVGTLLDIDGAPILPRDILRQQFINAPDNILDPGLYIYHGNRYTNFVV